MKQLPKSPAATTLKRFRIKAGLTQAYVAKLIGVSDMSISRWEKGVGTMHPAFWALLKIRVDEYLQKA